MSKLALAKVDRSLIESVEIRAFGREIEDHLSALGWSHAKLCQEAEISKAQLSGWLHTHDRSVGRNHILRLAVAIARGYDELRRTKAVHGEWGVDTLDALINRLFWLAGYTALTGWPQDLAWTRLSEPGERLTVGWIRYPPFCYSASRSRTTGEDLVAGIAIEITTRVADLLGIELKWRELTWEDVFGKLRLHEVDIICPILMLLPARMLKSVSFSTPIPGAHLAVNGIVHSEYADEVREIIGSSNNVPSGRGIVAHAIGGEVGQSLRRIFAPSAMLGSVFVTEDEAWKELVAKPIDEATQRVRCLVADHTICVEMRNRSEGRLTPIFAPENVDIKLPLAFGLNVHEPKLTEMINTCVKLMEDSGYFEKLWKRVGDKVELRNFGIIVNDRVR
jgi:hypothetical protein